MIARRLAAAALAVLVGAGPIAAAPASAGTPLGTAVPAGAVPLSAALPGAAMPGAAVRLEDPSGSPSGTGTSDSAGEDPDDELDPLQVAVDRLRPVVPAPGGTLVVAGRVTNTTDAPVEAVAVRLRLSTAPLTARAEITAIAEGDPSRDGLSVDGSTLTLADSLPAQGQRRFRIELPIDALPFVGSGVFVLGVESLGRREGIYDRQGLTRTFLPWFPDPAAQRPTGLVWLWPLADAPARDSAGVLLDDRTPRSLSPGGRLRSLVDIAASSPATVSWVVDPALLQTADDMTEGYLVLRGGEPQPGDRSDAAADWLAALRTATSGAAPVRSRRDRRPRPVVPTMRVLPYADVDAAALRRSDLDSDVVRAVTSAPPVARAALGRPITGGLFWAPSGAVDRPTLDLLTASGVDTVVVSTDSLPPDPPLAFTPSGSAVLRTSSGSVRAIVTDPGLTAALSLPQRSRDEIVLARQRFLAETGVVTTELPETSRTVVAAPAGVSWGPAPRLASGLLQAVTRAPWIRPRSLDDLLADAPSDVRRDRQGYPGSAREAELPPTFVQRIGTAQENVSRLGAVVDNPAGMTEPYAAALLRAASVAWRTDPRTGGQLLRRVEDELAAETAQVRVLSKGTVTFSGERGSVPVTIANDLDRPVTVGLRLIGQPAARLESEVVERVEIEPGRKASVEVGALVVGGGPLPVQVQLLTPDGDDYGQPVAMELRSTAYARAAAWVAGGAFALLAVFVGFGIARRLRAAGNSNEDDPSGTVSP